MLAKPEAVFDRHAEWEALARFATSPAASARFGVVSGRRRQGKTFLLDALARATDGFYFAATEDTELESLRRFGRALAARAGTGGAFELHSWEEALRRLYAVVPDGLIIIDELPYLLSASPSLASQLQHVLDPGGVARETSSKLLVCGSAMAVMGNLLAGNAPLRGRASLELVVPPMDYRTAAEFWGVADQPELAVLLHSIVGGTPAYRHEFVHSDAPAGLGDFDSWVIRTVLNPAVPLFREARYLLAEETGARDTPLYHGVLGAIALGHNTRGGIAGYLERPSTNIGHPLTVLEDCGLVAKEPDAFRTGRSTYRIAEPLITFYSAVMRRNWSFLERGMAEQAWQAGQETFRAQVVGPHFEQLCREFALRNAYTLFGEPPSTVAAGTVADQAARTQIQIDVAVLGTDGAVLSLGEAKWRQTMGIAHLDRLRRARDLLAAKGHRVARTRLACYSGAGFTDELRKVANAEGVLLVDLPALYADPS
ncbi:ATP-binding protein [Catellatospora bangladeshensis]|uniref:ATPase AAA n=1 Tax=Catellatospora bangladeshensis TaxID=310355 RepID=A0A8J3JIX5_9ACTN|nr:ATP-binding protein [Catellatospora bangladeshensis]GIF81277.1 ATPase AAA [Catellatospora bangladeshensis]